MRVKLKSIIYVIAALAWESLAISSRAQEVTISDPALTAAILEALQKSAGPLPAGRLACGRSSALGHTTLCDEYPSWIHSTQPTLSHDHHQ
jgi:hypothetical protein